MTTAVLQPLHALSMPTTASAMADPHQDDHALPTPKLSSAEVDPQLEILQAMFPDVDTEVLATVLDSYGGNAEQAVTALVDITSGESGDAEFAAQLQLEIDQEVAQALEAEEAASLTAMAGRAEVRSRARATQVARFRQQQQQQQGSTEGTKKRLLQLVRGRTIIGNARARLLDDHDGQVTSSTSPMASPLIAEYMPPLIPAAAPAEAAEPPTTDAANADRYASRVQRARFANQARARSPTAADLEPLGELV